MPEPYRYKTQIFAVDVLGEPIPNKVDRYSEEPSVHVSFDTRDTERYADHVAKAFHKARREEWKKSYRELLMNKRADQAVARGVTLSSTPLDADEYEKRYGMDVVRTSSVPKVPL
jgi:hypothetical protein